MYSAQVGNTSVMTSMNPIIIERYWHGFSLQLTPFNSVITISGSVFDLFDGGAIQILLAKYMYVGSIS